MDYRIPRLGPSYLGSPLYVVSKQVFRYRTLTLFCNLLWRIALCNFPLNNLDWDSEQNVGTFEARKPYQIACSIGNELRASRTLLNCLVKPVRQQVESMQYLRFLCHNGIVHLEEHLVVSNKLYVPKYLQRRIPRPANLAENGGFFGIHGDLSRFTPKPKSEAEESPAAIATTLTASHRFRSIGRKSGRTDYSSNLSHRRN